MSSASRGRGGFERGGRGAGPSTRGFSARGRGTSTRGTTNTTFVNTRGRGLSNGDRGQRGGRGRDGASTRGGHDSARGGLRTGGESGYAIPRRKNQRSPTVKGVARIRKQVQQMKHELDRMHRRAVGWTLGAPNPVANPLAKPAIDANTGVSNTTPYAHDDYKNRLQYLEDERPRLKARLIKDKLMNPDGPIPLDQAVKRIGLCTEMCPEFERVRRIEQKDMMVPEYTAETITSERGERIPDEARMVKAYQRSAAGMDEELVTDIRSPAACLLTLKTIFKRLDDEPFERLYNWLWDRTRAVRKDLSQQSIDSLDDKSIYLECFEQVARFHLVALHLMGLSNSEDYSHQQNLEQLNMTFSTLKFIYQDNRIKHTDLDTNNHTYSVRRVLANEAELQAYRLIVTLYTNQEDVVWEITNDRSPLRHNRRVQVAMEICRVGKIILDRPKRLSEAQQNWKAFWKLIESSSVSYLMACAAEISFNKIRHVILEAIFRVYKSGARSATAADHWTVSVLAEMMGFDTAEDVQSFCGLYGFSFLTNANGEAFLDTASSPYTSRLEKAYEEKPQMFSQKLVESKRFGRSLSAVIQGMSVVEARNQKLVQSELTARVDHGAEDADSLFIPYSEVAKDSSAMQTNAAQTTTSGFGIATGTTPKQNPFAGLGQASGAPTKPNPFGSTPNATTGQSNRAASLDPKASPFAPGSNGEAAAASPFAPPAASPFAAASGGGAQSPFSAPSSTATTTASPFSSFGKPTASPFAASNTSMEGSSQASPFSFSGSTGGPTKTPEQTTPFSTATSTSAATNSASATSFTSPATGQNVQPGLFNASSNSLKFSPGNSLLGTPKTQTQQQPLPSSTPFSFANSVSGEQKADTAAPASTPSFSWSANSTSAPHSILKQTQSPANASPGSFPSAGTSTHAAAATKKVSFDLDQPQAPSENEQSRQAKEEQDRRDREAKERQDKEEAERKAKEEAKRKIKEEQEKRRLEQERIRQEQERLRQEEERRVREEQERAAEYQRQQERERQRKDQAWVNLTANVLLDPVEGLLTQYVEQQVHLMIPEVKRLLEEEESEQLAEKMYQERKLQLARFYVARWISMLQRKKRRSKAKARRQWIQELKEQQKGAGENHVSAQGAPSADTAAKAKGQQSSVQHESFKMPSVPASARRPEKPPKKRMANEPTSNGMDRKGKAPVRPASRVNTSRRDSIDSIQSNFSTISETPSFYKNNTLPVDRTQTSWFKLRAQGLDPSKILKRSFDSASDDEDRADDEQRGERKRARTSEDLGAKPLPTASVQPGGETLNDPIERYKAFKASLSMSRSGKTSPVPQTRTQRSPSIQGTGTPSRLSSVIQRAKNFLGKSNTPRNTPPPASGAQPYVQHEFSRSVPDLSQLGNSQFGTSRSSFGNSTYSTFGHGNGNRATGPLTKPAFWARKSRFLPQHLYGKGPEAARQYFQQWGGSSMGSAGSQSPAHDPRPLDISSPVAPPQPEHQVMNIEGSPIATHESMWAQTQMQNLPLLGHAMQNHTETEIWQPQAILTQTDTLMSQMHTQEMEQHAQLAAHALTQSFTQTQHEPITLEDEEGMDGDVQMSSSDDDGAGYDNGAEYDSDTQDDSDEQEEEEDEDGDSDISDADEDDYSSSENSGSPHQDARSPSAGGPGMTQDDAIVLDDSD